MGILRRAVALALVLLATPMLEAGPGSGGAAAAASTPGSRPVATDVLPPGGSWTVTLITGDVVDVSSDGEGRVSAVPRDPARPLPTVQTPSGDLYVIPLAVSPLVGGVLDRELFNVTALVRQGYDDASTASTPVIVQQPAGVEAAVAPSPGRVLPSIGAVATGVTKGDSALVDGLSAGVTALGGGVTHVWLDRQVVPLAEDSPAPQASTPRPNLVQVGADRAWAAGFTGEGATVAVLDSGIDAQHPDLAGRVVAAANFSASPDVTDRYGHGTHVASIAVGVAPGARLINGKVVGDFGGGLASDAIAGMEWAAPQADVVNMSLGYGFESDGTDPISLALDRLTEEHGTLFVVAAGNSGPASQTVMYPGAAERALTVGAVDGSDGVADFSSRGPLTGSLELKPEIVAPGVDIVAARAAGTTMGEPVDEHYTKASGTSMAAPHVAGAAAVLAQRHPDWGADQLENGLVSSADPVDADGYDTGAGRLDVGDGVHAALAVDRDVVDARVEPRSEPHVETVTWTNTSDDAQTLRFAVELEDRGGRPVDAVSVEPAELTVAPGASGSALVSIDGPDLAGGLYSGIVTADPVGGDTQDDLRTPVGVYAGPGPAELTISATPPRGTSGPVFGLATVVNLDDLGLAFHLVGFEDATTLAVPAGRYAVLGYVVPADPDVTVVAQVGDPDVAVTGATTVAFDGASAVPLDPVVEGVDTAPPMYSHSKLAVMPRHGAAGLAVLVDAWSYPPLPPLRVTAMEAPSDVFAAFQIFRLQAPPLVARTRGEALDLVAVHQQLPPGRLVLTAVDAGDGADLSGARGALAVVRVPADLAERAAVSRRAAEAGVVLLAFVDEQRQYLTLQPGPEDPWGEVPVVTATGATATRLLAAADDGVAVRVRSVASPFVYDIVTPEAGAVDVQPVIDRAEQRSLARLDERFHRDPAGIAPDMDRRSPVSVDITGLLFSVGPLPSERIAYVTPDVAWSSVVFVDGFHQVSRDAGRSYPAGSRTRLAWLRRPMWPGPVGGFQTPSCQPRPAQRDADTMTIELAAFQDGPDRFGCVEPDTAAMTLRRDGEVVGSVASRFGEFTVPEQAGTYSLSYEQTGHGPYPHRSTTVWTFGSEASVEALPLLVVDYELPLDTLNRRTGRTATFTVRPVTGAAPQSIRSLEVWSSTDGGGSWRPAPVRHQEDGRYRVVLPRPGDEPLSLRVDARDEAGNRIEQTLFEV